MNEINYIHDFRCKLVNTIPTILEKKFSIESLDDPRGLVNPSFVLDSEKTSSSNPAISSPSSFVTATESKKC